MRLLLAALLCATPVQADSLVAARIIKANTVIAPEDVSQVAATIPGAIGLASQVVGHEAKVTLYPGRPIRAEDLGTPTLVDRNQKVVLVYQSSGLTIRVDGRALDRAGLEEPVRVMNLSSRQTVTGLVAADGSVHVGASQGMTQ